MSQPNGGRGRINEKGFQIYVFPGMNQLTCEGQTKINIVEQHKYSDTRKIN